MPRAKKLFFFDSCLVDNPRVLELIENSLYGYFRGTPMSNTHSKLKACRRALLEWNRNNTTNSQLRIKHLQKELVKTKTSIQSWNSEVVRSIEKELAIEIINEEKFWAQKARVDWLKAGD